MRVVAGVGAGGLDLAPHALHRAAEVAVAGFVLGPARRVDPGLAVERVDASPLSSASAGRPRQVGAGAGLQFGIVDEGDAGFLGLGQVELGGADALDPERREQVADLAQLARHCGSR